MLNTLTCKSSYSSLLTCEPQPGHNVCYQRNERLSVYLATELEMEINQFCYLLYVLVWANYSVTCNITR